MAPLSKLALLSLVSLTLQYSLLSIVLHLSLHSSSSPSSTPSSKYHTSSLVFLTELFKILLALFCVYFSKELRPGILDIKRLKWEQQARDELDREIDERPVHPVVDHDHKKDGSHWSTGDQMEKDSKVNGRSSSISAASASSTSNAPGSPPSLSTSPTHQRKSNSTSESPLRISVTAAQSNSAIPAIPFISHPPPSNSSSSNSSSNSHGNPFSLSHSSKSSFHIDQQPHFALIPATPAAPPSPYRIPNTTQLFPTRIPRPVLMSNLGLWDVLDKDSWIVLKSIVWGQGWWKLGIPSALFVFQANAQCSFLPLSISSNTKGIDPSSPCRHCLRQPFRPPLPTSLSTQNPRHGGLLSSPPKPFPILATMVLPLPPHIRSSYSSNQQYFRCPRS